MSPTAPSPDANRLESRRALLGAGACILLAPSALAQQPAPAAKGPRVFLDYDQAALDAAYDQSVYAPNQSQITGRYATNSETARARLGQPRRIAYGSTEVEKLDLFAARRPNAPILVFVHGGAWRGGQAKNYAYPAETFVRAGAHYVVLDFAWVQNVDGNLFALADQVRRAIAWCFRNAPSFGGDSARIYVAGHSSGAHLASVIAITDWRRDFGLPADAVKGYVLVSGIYELQPVRLSSRSSYIRFTDEMVQALSPMRRLDLLTAPVYVAHGTLDTPEFRRQSRELAEALRQAGRPVLFEVADGYNHFEIIETFANPFGLVGRAALEMLRLQV